MLGNSSVSLFCLPALATHFGRLLRRILRRFLKVLVGDPEIVLARFGLPRRMDNKIGGLKCCGDREERRPPEADAPGHWHSTRTG